MQLMTAPDSGLAGVNFASGIAWSLFLSAQTFRLTESRPGQIATQLSFRRGIHYTCSGDRT